MAKSDDAKPKFPTKPCPKCGKPIHARKMKHEECGWVAEAMPAAARATKPNAKAGAGVQNGEGISKMDAVRQILDESGNDIMPAAIQDQLKKTFKIKMVLPMISNYKSIILKSGSKKKLGRPKGSVATVKAVPTPVTTGISLDDIRAVKKLIDAIGADKVKELAGVLAN